MNGRKSFGGGGGGGRGKTTTGQQGKDGQRRPMFRRRKVCKFCSDKIDDINYKDVRMLMPFVPERAKVCHVAFLAPARCINANCGRPSCARGSSR